MRVLKYEPGIEVSGASIMNFVRAVSANDYASVAKEHNYDNINPNEWYPFQGFLDFLSDISQRPGLMMQLVGIGMSMAQFARIPPELKEPIFVQIMMGWDAHYQANFRNGPVGNKTAELVEPNHYKIIHHRTAMPDDLEYGMIYGFAKRFLPPGTPFTVWYDEATPRMDQGGEQTVIHVRWG